MRCVGQYMCGDWERLTGPEFSPNRQGILLDKNTGETYNKDSENIIRAKCGVIVIGNALRTIAVVVYDSIYLLWNVLKIVSLALWNFGKEFLASCRKESSPNVPDQNASFSHAVTLISFSFLGELLYTFGKDVWRLTKDPLCGIAIEICAFYGLIIAPQDGRKMIGQIEKYGFNDGQGFKEKGTYYLAPCFQPRPSESNFIVPGDNRSTVPFHLQLLG